MENTACIAVARSPGRDLGREILVWGGRARMGVGPEDGRSWAARRRWPCMGKDRGGGCVVEITGATASGARNKVVSAMPRTNHIHFGAVLGRRPSQRGIVVDACDGE